MLWLINVELPRSSSLRRIRRGGQAKDVSLQRKVAI